MAATSEAEIGPLHYVDFLPKQHYCSEIEHQYCICPGFETLVGYANDWLRAHRESRVVTIQSVSVKERSHSNIFNAGKVTYTELGNDSRNFYITVLRMWVRPRRALEPVGHQQFGYRNVVPDPAPNGRYDSGIRNFDRLSVTLSKLNEVLTTDPLPGRFINVETLPMKLHNRLGGNVDPEETRWTESGGQFLMVLRLFFEIGEPGFEKLGCADFAPANTTVYHTDYESFGDTLARARTWLERQQGIRFVSVQSIDYKMKKHLDGEFEEEVVDTHRPTFSTDSSAVRYVRILRLYYVRQSEPLTQHNPLPPMPSLHYKTFEPVTDEDIGMPMACLWNNVKRWLKATGVVNFLSVELIWIRASSIRPSQDDSISEKTYSKRRPGLTEMRVAVIRLYVDGRYVEPREDIVHPVTRVPDEPCCVVL